SRIPGGACVYRHDAGFFAEADAVDDRFGPWPSVAEARLVVVGEDSEHGRAETYRAQDLRTGCGQLLRVVLAHEVSVWKMDEQRHACIDRSDHGLRAHRVHLDGHADLLRFIKSGPQHFELFLARTGYGSQRDLARKFDSHFRHLADFRAGG